MSNFVRSTQLAVLLVGALVVSSSAMAAGFEKSLTWSAKSAAQGGAVVGSVAGAEALYFNPAGLAESSTKGEISGNFSPTFSQFQGVNPFSTAGSIKGKTGFSPVFGLVASFKPMPKLGIGVGYYVSGGTKSKYEDLDYSNYNANFDSLHPTVETNLAITEAAIGAGYEVMPGLRFGLSWRVVMVDANFSTVVTNGTTVLRESDIENIKATRWNAFKLGAQYEEPNHRWGLGAAFRSSVDFTASGDSSLKQETSAPATNYTTTDTGKSFVSNTFPYQINFGGWTRATELVRVGYEYNYTHYNSNQALVIQNGVTGAATITQNWKNMHVVRLGMEYTGMAMPIRAGYAYTSAVTPTDRARSTFASPGSGHALAVGTGLILANNMDLDGALEYSFAGGTGKNVSGEVTSDSDFKSHAYAAHISGKYHF
jgi:hypothetical protein